MAGRLPLCVSTNLAACFGRVAAHTTGVVVLLLLLCLPRNGGNGCETNLHKKISF